MSVRNCSVENCKKPMRSLGLCKAHYQRQRKHGTPLGGRASPGELGRFYREVVLPYDKDDCLIWPYSTSRGYGQMWVDGEAVVVSRHLCEAILGPAPTPKHDAAHSCGNGKRGCVTAGHLSWKTRPDNSADKLMHGTHNRGERHSMAKITELQATEIRGLKGKETQTSVAARFGISRDNVSKIQNHKSWAWLGA